LSGDFPPGTRLGEERLAAEIGVSRTPIREALSRLHSEGLVERLTDGGFGPTLINLHLIRELYEIRFALERFAVRRTEGAGPAHDEALVRQLRQDWLDLEVPESDEQVDGDFVLLDEDFHERLAASAGNGALVEQLHKVNERIRIVRMQDFLAATRVQRTVEQHVGVLDAVLDGDLAEAERRLVGHLDESLAVVEQRAALTIARMLDRRPR
jgi:DNA-binding GntR family transcriptional regulator